MDKSGNGWTHDLTSPPISLENEPLLDEEGKSFTPPPLLNSTPSPTTQSANLYLSSLKKTWLYLKRAASLRCPVCGISPIFPPFYQFTSISHWFTTLPDCPHCNFKYYREPGYFQIVIWFLNIEAMIFFGIIGFVLIDQIVGLTFLGLLLFNFILVLIVNILTIRHAKAFFIAFDHLVDPHSQPNKK